jgi:Zn-dependent M28 family amino/carboxypeptidase
MEIRDASLADLLRGRDVDLAELRTRGTRDMRVDRVEGPTLTLTQRLVEADIAAPNVVGLLEGSDPNLSDEYVIFSGHMDHVGIGAPDANGDSIFNGADDDASGTVAVIEIAEAVASLPTPPRRSMLFLLVSGEEKGLWGSEYYADNPSVPVESMVADFNTDMVGRNWPDTIVAIGKEHSDLGQTLERVNAAHPELGMTAIDDLWPEESFYTRSDHFNFARKGVPILFFFNGTHDDYHGRDDEVDRIDGEKAARIARLVFYLGVEVANAEERPRWNPDSYARIVSDRSR